MAVVQLITLGIMITDSPHFTASDRWDGYVAPITRDFPEGPFQGYMLDWGGFNNLAVLNSFANQQYAGYTTNFNASFTSGSLDAAVNSLYAGYTTNWGQYTEPVNKSIDDVDMNSIIDHPKDQTTFYKLKGWNNITQQYESWVVSQNITARPSLDGGLFDPIPGHEPPNVERDVFKTPPSGNTLSNIIIVAKWFE